MAALFVQVGRRIDYTPEVEIPAGAVVVQGELVGVARRAIPAGAIGALAVEGIFDFPKTSGAGSASTSAKAIFGADDRVSDCCALADRMETSLNPLPSGERASPSAMRSAGAMGWKSVSAIIAFQRTIARYRDTVL